MNATLRSIYISFNHADIAVREKVALSEQETKDFLCILKNKNFAKEFLVLSTCNRTELYYLSTSDLKETFIQELCAFRNTESLLQYGDLFISESDPEKTADRLFLVSNGVLSNILGDIQIVRQVKNAYRLACESGTAGPVLHRLLQLVFASHKDVSVHTGIHEGGASVATVASEMVLSFIRKTDHSRVLVIGAGEFSGNAIEQLRKKSRSLSITIMNRSRIKSEKLSAEFCLHVLPFNTTPDLSEYDVIISCISSSSVMIDRRCFHNKVIRKKLLIDLSVPRVFDPALSTLTGMKLVNIDQIVECNKQALQKRRESIQSVREIISRYKKEFMEKQHTTIAAPVLHHFKNTITEICTQEVHRHLKKQRNITDPAIVDGIVTGIVNKITKMPAIQLTQCAASDLNALKNLSDALTQLFKLKPATDRPST